MNKNIARVLYYTHDKWEDKIQIKHREELITMLEFCLTHSYSKTEKLLEEVIKKAEKGELLMTVGLIKYFIDEIPEVMQDYKIFFSSNNLIDKLMKEQENNE